MNNQPERSSFRDELLMDRLQAPMAFSELTTLVESVMLKEPLKRPEVVPYTGERAVIAKLGTQGLRLLLETEAGTEDAGSSDEMLRMIERPETMVDAEMPGVAEWAEAFGDALLKDAYKCLGKDAEQKVQEYAQATTAEQQEEIVMWLNERLEAMQQKSTDGTLVYHPIRLSPQAIGRYPHTRITPTCLGFSMLSSSFFYAAGAPTMHAGAMQTRYQVDAINAALTFDFASDRSRGAGDNETLNETLYDRSRQMIADIHHTSDGYHAATLTRLIDGKWMQVDPNFGATTVIYSDFLAQSIDQAYRTVTELKDIAPTLELGVGSADASLIHGWMNVAYKHGVEVQPEHLYALRDAMTDDNYEAIPTRIYRVLIDIYRDLCQVETPEDSEYRHELEKGCFFYDKENGEPTDDDEPDYYSDSTPLGGTLYSLIHRCVLHGQSGDEFKERCRNDRHYLRRRLADVYALAYVIPHLQANLLFEARMGEITDISHPVLEVGRPAARVAMAVLSDFAILVANDPLPPSFWHSNWPSLVPVAGATNTEYTDTQHRAMLQMVEMAKCKSLNYLQLYDNITDADTPATTEE